MGRGTDPTRYSPLYGVHPPRPPRDPVKRLAAGIDGAFEQVCALYVDAQAAEESAALAESDLGPEARRRRRRYGTALIRATLVSTGDELGQVRDAAFELLLERGPADEVDLETMIGAVNVRLRLAVSRARAAAPNGVVQLERENCEDMIRRIHTQMLAGELSEQIRREDVFGESERKQLIKEFSKLKLVDKAIHQGLTATKLKAACERYLGEALIDDERRGVRDVDLTLMTWRPRPVFPARERLGEILGEDIRTMLSSQAQQSIRAGALGGWVHDKVAKCESCAQVTRELLQDRPVCHSCNEQFSRWEYRAGKSRSW